MIAGLFTAKVTRNIRLHDYQLEAVAASNGAWQQNAKNVLCVLPTGGGKSAVCGEVIAQHVEEGGRALMCVHTKKLAHQFAHVTEMNFGIWCSVETGDSDSDHESPVVCGTVQSLHKKLESGEIDPKGIGLLIIDEAHRSLSSTTQRVVESLKHARVFGVTATPRRGDQKDLMKFFDAKSYDLPLSNLIERGFLAPLVIKNIPLVINIKSESKTGDFKDSEVAHAIEPYLDSCADEMVRQGRDRCSLVFLPLVEISKGFADRLNQRGLKTVHLDGSMKAEQVNRAIAMLERGEISCICNSMLLTEGVDIRPVNMILNLRPTRSWTLYTQIAGRGTRTFDPANLHHNPHGSDCRWPLKSNCVLLDPLWQCEQHNLLQRPSTLFAESDEEADDMDREVKKQQEDHEGDAEFLADLLEARNNARQKREESLRKRLEEMSFRKAREVNAVELFSHMGRLDLAEYEPTSRWELEAVTPGQRKFLESSGIALDSIQGKGHASKVLEQIIKRRQTGLCSVKQARFATTLGMVDAWNQPGDAVGSFIQHKLNERNNKLPLV